MNVFLILLAGVQALTLAILIIGLVRLKGIIMANDAEAVQQVKDLTAKINKIGTETSTTLAKVIALQAIIDAGNGGSISAELQAALNEATAAAQSADDLTPDAPA